MTGGLLLPDPEEAIGACGPWEHRTVAANGARFHLVEAGTGPLVVLLHGFPTYWYSWRRHLSPLAEAGFRAVAVDLRGYGGSDKTPHGYDPLSLCADIAGVIKTLGERRATIVGHGWGGLLAWTMASARPEVTHAIAPVSMPHPIPLRAAMLRDRAQRREARYVLSAQLPFLPERRLTDHGASRVAEILRSRSADASWLDGDTEVMFRAAMLAPASAHCALEYHRWAIRSIPRRDGRAFMAAVATPVIAPVLQVHGTADPSILPTSVDGSQSHVAGPYQQQWLNAGHYPHEECAQEFASSLIEWLSSVHPR